MNPANRLKTFLFFVADVAALYAALFLMLAIRYGVGFYEQLIDVHLVPFSIIFIPWILIFYIAGLYDLRRLRNNLDFFKTLFLSLSVNAVIAALLFYLVPAFGIAPKTNLLLFVIVFAVLEFFWRQLLNRLMAFGGAPNKILFIGKGRMADEIKQMLKESPQLGYAIVKEVPEDVAHEDPGSLIKEVDGSGANLVLVPHHLKSNARLVAALYKLFGRGILVSDLAQFYEAIMRKVPLSDLEESWFLENIEAGGKFYDPLKRGIEFVLALVIGIVLLPVEIVIGILVKLTSRGPMLIRQKRTGQNGKVFTLIKFRSMVALAADGQAETDGAQWSNANDPRITFIGKIIRTSHLDELPQLWNIIKGETSFVGPRPERPEIIAKLKEEVPYYEVRLLVKPGVTGWAQINYPADKTIDDVKQKLQYDVYYLKNRSLILDGAIILKTLKSFFVNPQ